MQRFSFAATDASGQFRQGTLQAENLGAALAELERQGLVVRSLSMIEAADVGEAAGSQDFRQRLAATLANRVRWLPALQAMAAELPEGAPKRETHRLVNLLNREMSVEEFLEHRDVATVLPLMTSAQESTNSAARTRDWLSDLLRTQQAFVKRRRALLYPLILLLVVILILSFFAWFLIPVFREMFEEFGLDVPAPTRLTFWLADQVSVYLLRTVVILGVSAVFLWLTLGWWRRRAVASRWLGKYVAGTTRNLHSMSAFTSALAELIHLGCPVPEALKIAGRGSQNLYYEQAAQRLASQVAQGDAQAMEGGSTALPSLVVQALGCGAQQTPSVPFLRELATIYLERAQSRPDFLTAGLPAIGVMIVGLLVGFVVIALFMPLVTMVSSLA